MAEYAEQEKTIRERFETDLGESKKFMDPIHMRMDKHYEQYRNRWVENEDQMQVSDLHAYVETVVPIITNNRTRVYVKAEDPEYIDHAKGMEYIVDHTYDQNNWDYKAQRIVRMAEIYRSGLAYTGYDPKANKNTGKLTITEINPRWCYFDPSVTELEDSAYFIYVEPMRKSKVKKMYPDKADEIGKNKDEGSFGDTGKSWFRSLLNTVKGYLTGVSPRDTMETMQELTEEEKRANAVAFIHYWYRDDDDNWRVAYFADELFLEDLENPFWHKKLPFDIFSPTEDILSVFGLPMAEQIEHLAYEKNILLHMFMVNAKKTADPVLMYNTVIGLSDPRDLKRKGDEDGVLGVNNPDHFPLDTIAQYMNTPQIPGWAKDIPQQFNDIQDGITGVNDSFRGMSEATSGKEVQLKQEAAYTRIKTKVDNFEKFVKSITEKVIVNAMQFIDSDTQFRVKGDYKEFEGQELPFDVETIPQGEGLDRTEFFLYANPNEWTKVVNGEESESDEKTEQDVEEAIHVLNMIVEIEAGSSLPTSRSAVREEALELFGAGAIDQQALLETFEYPNYEEIIQRMTEQLEQDKEREMKMAQSQIPPVPQAMPQGMPMQGPMQQGMGMQGGLDPQLQMVLNQFRQMLAQTNPEIANMDDIQLLQLLQEIQNGQMPPQAPQAPLPNQGGF